MRWEFEVGESEPVKSVVEIFPVDTIGEINVVCYNTQQAFPKPVLNSNRFGSSIISLA